MHKMLLIVIDSVFISILTYSLNQFPRMICYSIEPDSSSAFTSIIPAYPAIYL